MSFTLPLSLHYRKLLTLFARCSQPRIVTADTQLGTRHVPAALNLPFGTLFFGYDLSNTLPPPGSAAEVAQRAEKEEKAQAEQVPFANIVGNGTTLSGRMRGGGARPPPGPATPATPAATPTHATREASAQPFSGEGNTLGGGGGKKKKVEVIEID